MYTLNIMYITLHKQVVAQGCSLSLILFSVFINDLLKKVEKAELGIHRGRIGGMLIL